jgi:predicted transcriptional regulator
MHTSQFDIAQVADVKTEMLKSLSTGRKSLDQLVMLPKFHEISSKVLAIALEELVFERMVITEGDNYSLPH